MVVLNFAVRGSVLSARGKLPQVTTRSNKFFTLNVELDDVWSEYTVTVFFSNKAKPDAAEDVFPVLLHDGSCIVPHEVLDASDTAAYVWLMGLKDDVRATTNIIPVPLTASGYLEGIAPEEPTPDVYTEILESVRGAYNIANDVRADADAGKFNGKPGPKGDPGSDASVTAENIATAMGLSGLAADDQIMVSTVDADGKPTAWKRKARGMLNVKDYGAVGDGVTDDTTAVQNALNAAQGKTLIIDGVCKITAPLIVKDNTEIIGIGSRASGFDSYVAGTLFTSANDKGIYKCLFGNLRLRNRNLSPTDADGQYAGQAFGSLYESRVTECYVEHFAQICSKMARISSIDHCEMYYINKYLVNDVIDSMIESNYINAKNTAAGRTIMVYGLFSNSMFANNFCDYWGAAFRLEAGSKPSNVVGNTFDNCVSVFRDYVVGLSIVGNNYTNIKYVSDNWQAGGQPSEAIQTAKWSVFKFDGTTASHTGASTHCSLLDTTFNSNTFRNCSYYIDVENGVLVYPVQHCKFSDNAWEGLLVDAAFTNPQSAYDTGGMRTVYFDFWEGQSVDVLPSANLVSNAAKSVATYDGMTLWYKKREIRNFNGAWRFADGSVLSEEIWDLADRTYLPRSVPANTPRTYSAEHWYKVGYNGAEYTDASYAGNPIVSSITKNGFTIQTKNTLTGLGFYLPHGKFTFSATLPTGIEAYLLVVPASGTLESRNQVASGATLNCNNTSKDYVLLFCSRTTTGTYTVNNISIRDNSYSEVSTAPYYLKEESQTKNIADTAGYYTSDTVEGALAEIGATLGELKAAINTIRGVS